MLKEVHDFLDLGRISKASNRLTYQLIVARHAEVKRFIDQMKDRVVLKKPQLMILEEALGYLPGGYTWRNLITRESMVKLIDCVSRIRELNRHFNRTGRGGDLNQVLCDVLAVPEERVQRRDRTRGESLRKAAIARMIPVSRDEFEHLYLASSLSLKEIAQRLGVEERILHRRRKY